jgi:perosamine synthetase
MIQIGKPWIGEEEVQAVARPLLSGWVTQGPEVLAFEHEFAEFVGAAHACAVSSCTAALHLALLAVGVRAGDEVITVSHSFIATANSVRYCGAIPAFADVEPETFNLDPSNLDDLINSRTRAILCVHQSGMPCDMGAILDVARRHSLPVVEDAAMGTGSEILWDGRWERIGKPHGDIACFSFHPRKLLTTGDGGMITTRNEHWDRQFRLWRQHAMAVTDAVRHSSDQVIFEPYLELGYNYRMTDIQAAIGRVQLGRIPQVIERRRAQVDRFREIMSDIPGLRVPAEHPWARSNWTAFWAMLPDGCDQWQVMQHMRDDGVATRRGIMCAHREQAYRVEPWTCAGGAACRRGSVECSHLPISEIGQERTIILPLFHTMTEQEQDRVADALRRACAATRPQQVA